MNRILLSALALLGLCSLLTSCDSFVFGNVHVDYEDSPLNAKAVPHSGADRYVDSLLKVKVSEPLQNPDPEGAFKDWATCLVMFKEGHSHGSEGMVHGNFVYHNAPWRQEEFAIIHNGMGPWSKSSAIAPSPTSSRARASKAQTTSAS